MSVNRLGTLRQFEILLAVYQCGSISKAAETLNLTQPTLSMQLKKLSEQNDIRLYDQVGKKLVFTEAGEVFVQSARAVLQEMETLRENLDQLHGLTKGTLRLAVVTSAKYFIPHLLGPFCQRYPGIDVQLKVGNREQVIERLAMAEDDFYVFSHVPDLPHISATAFLPNPLIAIAAPSHPLAKQTKVSLADLSQHAFLAREPGSGTRHAIERFLHERGIDLQVRMTIESNEAIKHCVVANLGFTILSAHALSFGGDEGVVKLPVDGFPIPSQWSFVWPNEKALSPIANVFLRYSQELEQQVIWDQLVSV
ncbi:LysR family transcriptional regulator [Reinekea sp. G2M2-21]|uniref:LysR family transcriptional regulator n=1 Tax=Reinekea sp. G2M2-21 TaxID=2788942 RepID=UPI0018ABC6CC|nr:LysR family transcriptional regulator [Reinekea sp. G2M2-21]